MTDGMLRPITRRRLLAAATALSVTTLMCPATAAPASLPAQPSLLVAGPAGSPLSRWAAAIAPALGQSMLGTDTLGLDTVGGIDGVTGVNQFQARIAPDGATALLLPGTALLAWLVGDSRVRFDAGSWAPLWGGSTTAIVATRAPIGPGATLRMAVGSVAGPELQALIALRMMDIDVIPVAKMAGDPLAQRDVDAVYVGSTMSRELLAREGWTPRLALAPPGVAVPPAGPPSASTLFVPALAADPALAAAFRAVSAAVSLDLALVMPAVAPATVLAWWRRGCEQLDDAASVCDVAARAGVKQADAGAIAAQMSNVALDTGSMLALRTLLAERYHWQPG